MAPKKLGLGKGLDALILPEEDISPAPAGELYIPLDKLKPNPEQPRRYFGEEELKELANSIREHGIIEPIIVQKGEGDYTIVAGERRYRAAQMAGLKEVPALVRSYTPEARLEIALIENIQRTDLNPIEEARAYKNLMELTGLSQDSVAAKVGKNRSTVANALRLLRLPPPIQESLERGEISPGHARAILQAAGGQDTLFREIRERGLSVREAERRAGELGGEPRTGPGTPESGAPAAGTPEIPAAPDPAAAEAHRAETPRAEAHRAEAHRAEAHRAPELADMEAKLIERFGTKVSIQGGLDKGSIRIDYYSMDDLDRLYDIILGT
ncbi:MAG: ParB/RepB/Spo0J family partition protein [Treponema sp.]|nr:ParB/RepB/Spo0J family partition protein [Treponema sp.]